jgi:regulation of enolase protein 1 (concanavalin A-like superfamily)
MSARRCHYALVFALLLAAVTARGADKQVEGWGTWVDPDGDCKVAARGDKLLVTVPGKVHDLWPESTKPDEAVNAPRIVRAVDGDFTMQVLVDGKVGGSKLYRSGTLVVWHDGDNFVRFDRACGSNGRLYCWLHVFRDKKRVVSLQKEPVKDVPTVLRLQRAGDRLRASFSQDGGKTFFKYPEHKIEHLPGKVQAGVAALNAGDQPFTAEFRDFTVTSDGKALK